MYSRACSRLHFDNDGRHRSYVELRKSRRLWQNDLQYANDRFLLD